jgi:hypothetical protein
MYALFRTYFDGVSKDCFLKDLNQKSGVVLLEREDGSLAGFTTLLRFRDTFKGRPIQVVYSGDTIVDREAWGTLHMPKIWLGTIESFKSETPEESLYWLLICSGYRTYRFLPVLWRSFFPNVSNPTPVETQDLMDQLAERLFGLDYNPVSGLVKFRQPQVLKPGISDITEARNQNPHIRFFAQKNSGFEKGDELVCLTELTAANQSSAGQRILQLKN